MNNQDWDLICDGNKDALGRLYDELSDTLYVYGMKIVANKEIVEDAIQDLFLSLFTKAKSISRPKSINVYLCVALKNRILNEIGTSRRMSTVPLESEDFSTNAIDSYSFNLEIDPQSLTILNEEEREQQRSLQEALNELTAKQREIIYLKYYKGLSGDEVAEIIDTSPQVIYNTTSQIMKKLKERLAYNKYLIILIFLSQNW